MEIERRQFLKAGAEILAGIIITAGGISDIVKGAKINQEIWTGNTPPSELNGEKKGHSTIRDIFDIALVFPGVALTAKGVFDYVQHKNPPNKQT